RAVVWLASDACSFTTGHTLGVDGGYTQDDVVQAARILTGWTFRPYRPGRGMDRARARLEDGSLRLPDVDTRGAFVYQFRPEAHDAGEKVVLGHRFEAGRGEDEGIELIRMLARHPSTAHHIARQLALRFVSDDPPERLVNDLAQVFLDTEGDLREVTRALFTHPDFYRSDVAGARVKSPFTLVAGTLRLTHARLANPRPVIELLRSLGEAPYLAEPPTGYEETSAGWAASGAMLNRMNFAVAFVSGEMRGVAPNGEWVFRQARTLAPDPLEGLARLLLPAGGADAEAVLQVVRDDLAARPPADEREAAVRAAALILGSPAYQRH
ncbi:MAG: DUF1800 family protein, partial [Gemmatimonadetes bacterium]